MIKKKTISVQTLIQNYFLERMIQQRGVSTKTISTYRDTFKIYIHYLQKKHDISVDKISIDDFNQGKVLLFLEYLEEDRHNKPVTLNNRLAIIHSFMKYVAEIAPEYSDIAKSTLMIPFKKHDIKTIDYVTKDEFKTILNQCKDDSYLCMRDRLMLMILYNTGVRVSELVDIKCDSIRGRDNKNQNYYLFIMGKGRKERTVPLWKSTSKLIDEYIKVWEIPNDGFIFKNKNHGELTRSGVRFRIEKLVKLASSECPSLLEKHITVHTFRHSVAMNLLQAGIDISTIAIWLGHSSIETTHKYMIADLEIKRKAMEKAGIIDIDPEKYKPSSGLLNFLSSL